MTTVLTLLLLLVIPQCQIYGSMNSTTMWTSIRDSTAITKLSTMNFTTKSTSSTTKSTLSTTKSTLSTTRSTLSTTRSTLSTTKSTLSRMYNTTKSAISTKKSTLHARNSTTMVTPSATNLTSTAVRTTLSATSFKTTTPFTYDYYDGSGDTEEISPDRLLELHIRSRNQLILLGTSSPAEFTCQVTADLKSISNVKTTWMYKGKDVIPTQHSRLQTTGLVYRGGNSYETNLTFKEMLTNDNGEVLVCSAEMNNVTLRGRKSIRIALTHIELDHINVVEGNSSKIECYGDVSSDLQHRIAWCKNGKPDASLKGARVGETELDLFALYLSNVSESATYGCGVRSLESLNYECDSTAKVTVYRRDDIPCPENVTWEFPGSRGASVYWVETFPGHEQTAPCPHPMSGLLTRTCERDGAVGRWGSVDNSSCINHNLFRMSQQISEMQSGIDSNSITDLLGNLSNETSIIRNRNELQTGNVKSVITILNGISNVTEERKLVSSKQDLQNFATTVNIILSPEATEVLNDLTPKKDNIQISSVMAAVTTFGFSAVRGLSTGNSSRVERGNIVIEARRSDTTEDIYFYSNDGDEQQDNVILRRETVINHHLKENGSVDYVAVYYNNSLPKLLPTKTKHKGINDSDGYGVSNILSFALSSGPQKNINPPVQLSFSKQLFNKKSQSTCVFWDFKIDDWSTEGCTQVNSGDDTIICQCDHLTNFAILISPYSGTSEHHHKALGILSIIGCVFSLIGIILTIIVYVIVWRQVKSEKSVLLINLCVSLSLAIIVFLLGVEQTQNKILCAVITGTLHYLFLCTFFLMFAEGVSVAISVVNVFSRRSYLKYFLPSAWGLPALIVAITYGAVGHPVNDRFCWLALEDRYLLLSFVVPALVVILANMIITIVVLRALFSTRSVMNRSQKAKIKTGMRSVAVLAPLLGLTWIFGVFSVNRSTVFFQYLFVLFNSLQGLFIFIFHCILNKVVRDTLYNRCPCFKERRRGSVTSRTPLSNKAESKPTSESLLDSQQKTLTLETPHTRSNTTSSFSYPNKRKQDDISTEKENEEKMNDYVEMPKSQKLSQEDVSTFHVQKLPQEDVSNDDGENNLTTGSVANQTEDTKL